MKSLIVGITISTAATGIAVNASGDTFENSAFYSVGISGRNSDGSFPPPNSMSETDVDFVIAGVNTEIAGGIDDGSATARAAATASHRGGRNDPKLAGLDVGGSANITKPATAGETGNLQVVATASVEYNDVVTYEFFPNDTPLRIQGYLRLKGNMDVAATKNGPDIDAEATTTINLSGTGMVPVSKFTDMKAGGTKNIILPDAVNFFSYDVLSGVPKEVQLKFLLSGTAAAFGAQFSNNKAASAAAGFTASFFDSLEWGGITKVTNLSTGEEITDWTVTSASGYDYSQVFTDVPEPSSWLLLLVGVAGCSMLRSR